MALKAVLLLATVALVSSQMSSCNTDDRDCRCADKSFKECQEPVTADMIHVADLAECKFQCDLFNSFGACDWFIYEQTGGMDENCHLFGPGKETMADYLSSCNQVGGALRNEAGECLDGPDAFCPSSPYCSGCVSCAADPCGLLVETECTIANSEVTTTPSSPSVEACRSVTTSQGNSNNINFFIYDQRAETCWGYDSGKRSCSNVVAAQTMDQATIDSCRA